MDNFFRYGVFKVGYDNVEAAVVYEDDFIKVTIPLIILWVYVLVLILREFWQMYKYKKRYSYIIIVITNWSDQIQYFHHSNNYNLFIVL